MRRLMLWCLTAGALAGAAACGVPTQDRPEVLDVEAPEAATAVAPSLDGGGLQLWFIRGGQLAAVKRTGGPTDVHTALDLLVAGPLASEVDSDLRTALAPQTVRHTGPTADDPAVTVAVTRDFTALVGGNQQLAVAQIVWTVTQFPQVREVRFSVDGRPLEVPTDDGLTGAPVDRDDYRSVAPR